MIFTEIGERATIRFHMADLAAMARACRAAYECGMEGYAFEAAASMFTMAAMIAYEHGDLPEEARERMADTHKRITTAGPHQRITTD